MSSMSLLNELPEPSTLGHTAMYRAISPARAADQTPSDRRWVWTASRATLGRMGGLPVVGKEHLFQIGFGDLDVDDPMASQRLDDGIERTRWYTQLHPTLADRDVVNSGDGREGGKVERPIEGGMDAVHRFG